MSRYIVTVRGNRVVDVAAHDDEDDEMLGIEWALSELKDAYRHAKSADASYSLAGEDELEALVRECEEELGVLVEVGERIGVDVPLAHGWALLRVWRATLVRGEPQALEHASLRWFTPADLDTVPWLPADAPIVAELARTL